MVPCPWCWLVPPAGSGHVCQTSMPCSASGHVSTTTTHWACCMPRKGTVCLHVCMWLPGNGFWGNTCQGNSHLGNSQQATVTRRPAVAIRPCHVVLGLCKQQTHWQFGDMVRDGSGPDWLRILFWNINTMNSPQQGNMQGITCITLLLELQFKYE